MGLWDYLGKLSDENIYGLITVLGRDFSRRLIKVYCPKITHNSKAVAHGFRGLCGRMKINHAPTASHRKLTPTRKSLWYT